MIIKGRSRKDGRQLARYLLREHSQQRVIIMDERGAAADDLSTIFDSWEAEAYEMSRARKPLYHVQLRLPKGEALSDDQWLEILDRLEDKLKLKDQPRVIVKHFLNGEPAHLHVVYSRFNEEHGRLVDMSHDARAHHAVARAIEREFGLRELDSTPKRGRGGSQRQRSQEHKMAKEAGTSRQALCAIVRVAWEASRTGRDFQDQLMKFGIDMTPGEKRDYNVWHNGKRYNPVRLLENIKAGKFRAKMQHEPPRFAERAEGPMKHSRARPKRSQRMTDQTTKTQDVIDTRRANANALVAGINRRLSERRQTDRDHEV